MDERRNHNGTLQCLVIVIAMNARTAKWESLQIHSFTFYCAEVEKEQTEAKATDGRMKHWSRNTLNRGSIKIKN